MLPYVELPIILAMSNNSIIVAFLKRNLKDLYYLLTVENEADVFDTLESSNIDLILIDDDMRAGDPLQLCATVRKMSAYKQTPMFLITTNLKKAFTEKAVRAGFTGFLNEPLEPKEVKERLKTALSSARTKKKLSALRPKGLPSPPKKARKYSYHSYFKDLSKAKRVGLPACLLLVQEDTFSKLVEKHGKTFAHKLHEQIHAALKKLLRPTDLLFAQKDGSFLLLLPKTSTPAGRAIAEMIREEIGDKTFKIGDEEIAITLSIGFAHHEDKAHPIITQRVLFERSFETAQRALLVAEQTGNRTAYLSSEREDHYEIIV